jgi:hypothetical protein
MPRSQRGHFISALLVAAIVLLVMGGIFGTVYLVSRAGPKLDNQILFILLGFVSPTIVALLAILKAHEAALEARQNSGDIKRLEGDVSRHLDTCK